MASLTKEQIEQKLQQLKQLTEEANTLTKELVEAGAIEIPDEDLDGVNGGDICFPSKSFIKEQSDKAIEFWKKMHPKPQDKQ